MIVCTVLLSGLNFLLITKFMSALKNLQDAVALLETVSTQVITALSLPGVAESDVQLQANAVITIAQNLQKALPGVPTPPAPVVPAPAA